MSWDYCRDNFELIRNSYGSGEIIQYGYCDECGKYCEVIYKLSSFKVLK